MAGHDCFTCVSHRTGDLTFDASKKQRARSQSAGLQERGLEKTRMIIDKVPVVKSVHSVCPV